MSNFDRAEEIMDVHPGWKNKSRKMILAEAEDCVRDSCLTEEDFLLLVNYLEE